MRVLSEWIEWNKYNPESHLLPWLFPSDITRSVILFPMKPASEIPRKVRFSLQDVATDLLKDVLSTVSAKATTSSECTTVFLQHISQPNLSSHIQPKTWDCGATEWVIEKANKDMFKRTNALKQVTT